MFDRYKDIFNQRGALYHQAMLECPMARREEFTHVINLADLSDGMVVADIPSGGCYLLPFIEQNIDLIAVETSDVFNRQAETLDNTRTIVCQDLCAMTLTSGSLDRVISLAGAHHLSNQQLFFSEVYRLLKTNGIFALADVRFGSGVARFLNTFVDQHNSMGHHGDFLSLKTREQLENSGFEVTRMETIDFNWNFKSEVEMIQFCRKLFGLDLADDIQILSGIRNHVGYTAGNDGCCLKWELLFFQALKK